MNPFPTAKDVYDSSKKQRVPSWTDRAANEADGVCERSVEVQQSPRCGDSEVLGSLGFCEATKTVWCPVPTSKLVMDGLTLLTIYFCCQYWYQHWHLLWLHGPKFKSTYSERWVRLIGCRLQHGLTSTQGSRLPKQNPAFIHPIDSEFQPTNKHTCT